MYCLIFQGLVLAGLGSGLTEGAMITPFERVKVSLQAQRTRIAEVTIDRQTAAEELLLGSSCSCYDNVLSFTGT